MSGRKTDDSAFRPSESTHQPRVPKMLATLWFKDEHGTGSDLCRQCFSRECVCPVETRVGASLPISHLAGSDRKDQSVLLEHLQSVAANANFNPKIETQNSAQ